MYNNSLICITERKIVNGDFLQRVEEIATMHPKAIILREKDLSFDEYITLAKKVSTICQHHNVMCILNWRDALPKVSNCCTQLPFHRRLEKPVNCPFGISIHSIQESLILADSDAKWLLAGHIFQTTCKPGEVPRGIEFLKDVVSCSKQPVYAVGGITPDNVFNVLNAGAKGYCVRSPLMIANDVKSIITEYYNAEFEYKKNFSK
ncbi:MAG: thiamine phosphate synthase [Tissierellia bacterium]|nr:thiamine phosphate synthase [Tissierellia bacterium]